MVNYSQTYLYQLFKNFKWLFVVVVVWAIGTLWFALKSREEFPFLLFGMYSLKEGPQKEYITYTLFVNGNEIKFNQIPDAKRELIFALLPHLENAPADSSCLISLSNYVTQKGRVEVYKVHCSYSAKGEPAVIQRQLIYAGNTL